MPHMLRAFTAVLTLIPRTAGAHHGWSGYESSQVLTLSGTIREAGVPAPSRPREATAPEPREPTPASSTRSASFLTCREEDGTASRHRDDRRGRRKRTADGAEVIVRRRRKGSRAARVERTARVPDRSRHRTSVSGSWRDSQAFPPGKCEATPSALSLSGHRRGLVGELGVGAVDAPPLMPLG